MLKAMARAVLGDYAPYYILECPPRGTAEEAQAGSGKYRVAPIDQEAILNCPAPLIRDQASYAGADLAYACRDGDRIVGICFYWHSARYRTRNFWPLEPGEAKLVQIITAPDMRGKKVAGTLISGSGDEYPALRFRARLRPGVAFERTVAARLRQRRLETARAGPRTQSIPAEETIAPSLGLTIAQWTAQ